MLASHLKGVGLHGKVGESGARRNVRWRISVLDVHHPRYGDLRELEQAVVAARFIESGTRNGLNLVRDAPGILPAN